MEDSKKNNVKKERKSVNPAKPAEMQISDNCVKLVAKFEGCRLSAYKCPAGVWTIGYGHTENVKQGDKLSSKGDAMALLKKDLKKYAGYVNDLMKTKTIRFKMNQNRFDALTSFVYNCGQGNLLRLVKNRNADEVAEAMLLYCKGGGKVLLGLKRRRIQERKLFNKGSN